MASITIYEISADPFSNSNIDVLAAYSADIIDNDAFLQDPDGDGSQQLDLSGVPNFHNASGNFQIFESYSGQVNGAPVTFTLIQFSNPIYVVVTAGQVAPGDTVTNTGFVGSAPASSYNSLPSFVCFTAGSLILTPAGQRRIETLQPGDLVVVADGQPRPVRWIGRRRLSASELRQEPHLCPVRISAGSFAKNCPSRDLLVSPQHRIAVSCARMEMMYANPEMLAPAKGLVDGHAVTQLPPHQSVEYIHILFDKHELVNVEGVWSESFYPGECTISAMTPATQRELHALFPDLMGGPHGYGATALPVLKPYEVRIMRRDLIVGPRRACSDPDMTRAA